MMPPKLLQAADVCRLAEVQPYVLRSWEKEFPGIGVNSTAEGGRLYRQADVEQVRRIRELVFGEGLTVSGARRRLEGAGDMTAVVSAEVFEALGADARSWVAEVRDGLQAILTMLSAPPGEQPLELPSQRRDTAPARKPPRRPAKKVPATRSGAAAKRPRRAANRHAASVRD